MHAEPGYESEVAAFNLFGYLSRSDVTWNPSVVSVCKDSLYCPTTEEFILPIIHGNDRVEWFVQLSDQITWKVEDRETGSLRATVVMKAGDVAAMPADIRHQGYSPEAVDAARVGERVAGAARPDRFGAGADRSCLVLRPASVTAVFQSLADAIATHVHDGDTVALEGFTHLIPFAAATRSSARNAAIYADPDDPRHRLRPDDRRRLRPQADLLVGRQSGCRVVAPDARRRPERVAGAARHRRAQPRRDGGALAGRCVRAAVRHPARLRRHDLLDFTDTIAAVTCPFTGEELTAVPALNPDVGIIHAQQADRHGNVMMWGITGVQRECVLASRRSIVTVEEVVDEFQPQFNAAVLPAWTIDSVVVLPGGAHPSYAHGYSSRDNEFYAAWDPVARDRETFQVWMKEHVLA